MTTAYQAEAEDSARLAKSAEFLAYSRTKENEARMELARAVAQTQRAKEKHEELFSQCEKLALLRRQRGEIETRID